MRGLKIEHRDLSRQKGLTLIEVAIVLIIIGIIAVPLMQTYRHYQIEKTKKETDGNISAVATALQKYVYRTGNYPIPAARNAAATAANVGRSATLPIPTCTTSATTVCRVTAAWATAPNNVVYIGVVPFATLGLPKKYAYDGYGNKLTYAVTASLTTGAFNDLGGIIRVVKINNAQREIQHPDAMHFVVISHGKDGKGAYSIGGTQAIPCGNPITRDNVNCDDNALFTDNFDDALTARNQDDSATASHYDDFLRYTYTLGGGLWQKVPPATDIFTNSGHVRVGPSTDYPQAQIDIAGTAGNPGNLRADRLVINRLCDYNEAIGCTPTTAPSGLVAPGNNYRPGAFQPGVIADNPAAGNSMKAGGGISCGTNYGMSGIANADEKCMGFPPPFAFTGCAGGLAPSGTDASGNFICVSP